MTEAEARARIEDATQWQASPALTAEEVDRLVARARVADADDVAPGDDGYIATFTEASLNAAIRDGFLMKAAKVAGQEDVSAGGASARRSQKADALRRQGQGYAGIGAVTLTTATALASERRAG